MPLRDPEARLLYAETYRHRPGVREYQKEYQQQYRRLPGSKLLRKLNRQRPEVQQRRRDYRKRPEVQQRRGDYRKRPEVRERDLRYNRRSDVKLRRSQRPWFKLARRRHDAIHRKRGFTPLCPNVWNCPVDYHHVSPNHPYVVPLPRAIHRAIGGSRHFIILLPMLCFFYGIPHGVLQ